MTMENTTIVAGKSGVIEATAKLVIKDFVEVMGRFRPGKGIESDSFMLGDIALSIEVYPNGYEDQDKGHVGIFLSNKGDADIQVKGQFSMDLKTMVFEYSDVVEEHSRWGIGNYLTHTECADVYKEKDFVVTAKLETDGDLVKLVGRQPDTSRYWDTGTYTPKKRKFDVWENVHSKMARTDFVLVFAGQEVPCHKHILAAASPVLEAMVENKHREAIESTANIKLSADVGKSFVRYIYTGEVQEDVLTEHASAFLAMGELYDLQELKGMAEKELLCQIEKENMVEMISIGDFYSAEDLLEAALKMTKVNMSWLRNQVFSMLWKASKSEPNFYNQDEGMEMVKKLDEDIMAKLL